jgi:hypothetical protein
VIQLAPPVRNPTTPLVPQEGLAEVLVVAVLFSMSMSRVDPGHACCTREGLCRFCGLWVLGPCARPRSIKRTSG